MKKILLLATALTLSAPSALMAADGGGDEQAEIERIAAPLINQGNADRVIEALLRVPATERADLVRLITNEPTCLVLKNRSNAANVIEALSYIEDAAERAALVHLITDPATRLVWNIGKAFVVINALREVPATERAALVDLITARETRLVKYGRDNAGGVIEALSYIDAAERAALVHLITAPETNLLTDNRRNAADVINALSIVPEAGRAARVARARAAVIALPWWREGMVMTNAQRTEFHHTVMAVLEGDRAEVERRPDVNPHNPGAAGGGGAEARLREEVASREKPEEESDNE